MKRKIMLVGTMVTVALMLGAVAGCAQSPDTTATTPDPYVEESYLPKVIENAEGKLIQITPVDDEDDIAYFKQPGAKPYNTYYLKADERGCKSCHEDLKQLLADGDYVHCGLRTLDAEWTVDQCIDCHEFGRGSYQTIEDSFATMIHGLHAETAQCWNCHDTSTTDEGSNSTMYLWESVKHSKLRGITDISEDALFGDFTYSQDETIGQDQLFDLNVMYFDWDFDRYDNTVNEVPLDESLIDDWTFTVDGAVDQTMTWNLRDLIDNAPSETKPIKLHCTLEPNGGGGIGQVMATGIPISWFTDQAGLKDSAISFAAWGANDGYLAGSTMESLEGQTAMLVYEINGEPLAWHNGYPCMVMIGGVGSGCFVKEAAGISFYDEAETAAMGLGDRNGWWDQDLVAVNTPNAGIIGLEEGEVIETGKPITIKGYADAYNRPITAIEISMDRGKTWKSFPVENNDTNRWTTWEYEFTPEADGAYCIAVRACTDPNSPVERKNIDPETGEWVTIETPSVTPDPVEIMVVSRSDVDALRNGIASNA